MAWSQAARDAAAEARRRKKSAGLGLSIGQRIPSGPYKGATILRISKGYVRAYHDSHGKKGWFSARKTWLQLDKKK